MSEPPRYGDLVQVRMNDLYFGIVIEPRRHDATVAMSNGLRADFPNHKIAVLPLHFQSESHANFAEIIRRDLWPNTGGGDE